MRLLVGNTQRSKRQLASLQSWMAKEVKWSGFSSVSASDVFQALRALGLEQGTSFEEVKQRFIQLALQTHPDKNGGSTDDFIRIRNAFETASCHFQGTNSHSSMVNEEMSKWFYNETGELLSFTLDEKTRQEAVRAYVDLAQGGRDPGEWELARLLAQEETTQTKKERVLQLGTSQRQLVRRKRKLR